jgi:glycine/D-amino acid oxidase-like deaminating enzyme
MRVLVVGAGVIGTVYGAHLAAAGNTVWVLSHGGGPTMWPPAPYGEFRCSSVS